MRLHLVYAVLCTAQRNVWSLLGCSCCDSHRYQILLATRLRTQHMELSILTSRVQYIEEGLQHQRSHSKVKLLLICATGNVHNIRSMI
jgi:hypothetical protein